MGTTNSTTIYQHATPSFSCLKSDNTIQWINRYPVESAGCCANTYPLCSDLSGGGDDIVTQPG